MIEYPPLMPLVLLVVRPGVLVATAPLFGETFAPAAVRVGVTAFLVLVLAPIVPLPTTLPEGSLVPVLLREALIGLALALAVNVVIAGAEMAGHLSGFQMGFGYNTVIDPQNGTHNTMMGVLYRALAILILFSTNLHHVLLRALAQSYVELPIGVGSVDGSLVGSAARMLRLVFVLGLQLAGPILVVLLVLEATLGILARTAPALNVVTAGFAVRAFVGLVVLALVVRFIPDIITRAFAPALELGARAAAAFR